MPVIIILHITPVRNSILRILGISFSEGDLDIDGSEALGLIHLFTCADICIKIDPDNMHATRTGRLCWELKTTRHVEKAHSSHFASLIFLLFYPPPCVIPRVTFKPESMQASKDFFRLFVLLFALRVAAQAQRDTPACVEDCISKAAADAGCSEWVISLSIIIVVLCCVA